MDHRNKKHIIKLSKIDPSDELVFNLVNKITKKIVESTTMNLTEIIIGKKLEVYGQGNYNNSIFILRSKYSPILKNEETKLS